MFRTIWRGIENDPDYPARRFTIDVLGRVRDGAFYDHVPQPFHEEKTDAGEYVPIRQRRPSVRCNLCRVVVDDAASLVFDEGHFPAPSSDDEIARAAAARIITLTGLRSAMLEAATLGSVGSAAIHMRVLAQAGGRTHGVLFFQPRSTEFLTPTFDPADPTRLMSLTERYKVRGSDLDPAYGVPPEKMASTYWFARQWDARAETWLWPQLIEEAAKGAPPRVDETRTVVHDLGFVPWVWIRNLPGRLRLIDAAPGPAALSEIDGACTFVAAIEAMIEIDYQLSQAGRGLKYSMDPMLVIKEPAGLAGGAERLLKSPASALMLAETGDAKMLEIGGAAFGVVLDYVRALRELALEQAHGARADPQRLAAATSGRAMELMSQSLIWLASKMRVSYGEGALVGLLRMALAANAKFPILLSDAPLGEASPDAKLTLKWPAWYEPTATDAQAKAQTLSTLTGAGLLSRPSAIAALAPDYDIDDPAAERARLDTPSS